MEPRERYMTAGVALFGILYFVWTFVRTGIPSGFYLVLMILVGVGTSIATWLFVRDWLDRR